MITKEQAWNDLKHIVDNRVVDAAVTRILEYLISGASHESTGINDNTVISETYKTDAEAFNETLPKPLPAPLPGEPTPVVADSVPSVPVAVAAPTTNTVAVPASDFAQMIGLLQQLVANQNKPSVPSEPSV